MLSTIAQDMTYNHQAVSGSHQLVAGNVHEVKKLQSSCNAYCTASETESLSSHAAYNKAFDEDKWLWLTRH